MAGKALDPLPQWGELSRPTNNKNDTLGGYNEVEEEFRCGNHAGRHHDGLSFMSAGAAQAQGALVMYCGVQEEWCRAMTTAFERETGIKVSMTRKSSGEIYAQVKAESANPRADIWWGGTGDPHMQAAEEGLTVEYKSPKMGELQDWAVRQWEQSKNRTVGIYSGALGFGYNTELAQVEQDRRAEMLGGSAESRAEG